MDTSSHGGPLSINTGIDGSMNSSQLGASMMSDGMSEPSSPEPTTFDESDLLQHTVHDDITAQLAAAGMWINHLVGFNLSMEIYISKCVGNLKSWKIIYNVLNNKMCCMMSSYLSSYKDFGS